MAQSSAMRLIQSKHVGYKIEIMKWSNRMDLLAISNDKGEVIIQRLNFQKIWTHPPPSDEAIVRGIDWRPDEKIIAVAYNTGLVILLDIENQHEINSFNLGSDVSCLSWTQNTREITDDVDLEYNLNSHETYLPQLPSFNSLSSTAPKTDYNSFETYSKKVMNILIIGLRTGIVHTSVFGVLSCGRINVAEQLQMKSTDFEIVSAKMSVDFKQIYVLLKTTNVIRLVTFENEMFANYLYPLLNLATKHGHILNTMTYIDDIIQCITEAWETALLEMDNKLTKYANSHETGSVSADFLELLMFGYPSESLELFLIRDLTEKGLKKLGTSIEISYSTIQKLVIKPLHSGILNVCYHLNSIKGMSRNSYYYQPILGKISNDSIRNAGAFLIKSLELQLTIEQSTRDYKIFWCWLYGVIIRLMEETVPDDIAAVSQQDIIYLAEFLNNFDLQTDEDNNMIDIEESVCGDIGNFDGDIISPTSSNCMMSIETTSILLSTTTATAAPPPPTTTTTTTPLTTTTTTTKTPLTTKKRFNLERVGQYLEDKNLQTQASVDLTQKWNQLLDENECIKDCNIIYPHQKELSLIQQHNKLKTSINELFSRPEKLMGTNFIFKSTLELANILTTNTTFQTSQMNIEMNNVSLFAGLISHKTLLILEIEPTKQQFRAIKLEFQQKPLFDEKFAQFGKLEFLDVQFYNETFLSIILVNKTCTTTTAGNNINDQQQQRQITNYFLQFPLATIELKMTKLSFNVDRNYLDISKSLNVTNLYELLDPALVRSLDGTDGYQISVSGSRKVASLISESQKRIRLYEMEVEEEDDDLEMSTQNNTLNVSKDSNQSTASVY